jgi:TolB protein
VRAGLIAATVMTAAAFVGAPGSRPALAAYPGANGRIAFVSDRDHGAHDIYSMNADGTDVRRLTTGLWTSDPRWSPDGTKIAFVVGYAVPYPTPYGTDIYSINADGSDVQRLTSEPGNDYAPTWSPDGTQIAFTSERRAGVADIYVMSADGSGVRRLASDFPALSPEFGARYRRSPAWSPDGSQIAYAAPASAPYANRGEDIFVMNVDGNDERRLTSARPDQFNSWPQWSPDGAKIGYTHTQNPFDVDVYVMNADGSEQTQLTTGPDFDVFGNWSPDGAHIVFMRRLWVAPGRFAPEFEHGNGIYTMDSDGSHLTQLQRGGDLKEAPDWQPLPRVSSRTGYCMPEPVMRADGTMGTFVDLVGGQPDTDPRYRGAVPAALVANIGLTCDRPYFP